ncbi:MAG: ABC transporter permease [Gemmatimonadaceae bacterium]
MTRGEGRWNLRRTFRLPATRQRAHAAVDEELHFHIEGRIEELMSLGHSRAEAETEARRRFGDYDDYKRQATAIDEQIIQERQRMDFFESIRRELRQAVHVLTRSPGFTITAVFTLALGLGAATAIFTMLDAVVLRPLPYADAEQLVELTSPVPKFKGDTLWGLARHEMFYFKESSRTLTDIGVYQNNEVTVGSGTSSWPAEKARAAMVSSTLFNVLGFRPMHGRLLTTDDNRDRQPHVVVLGEGYWKRRFGGDEKIVGSVVDIEGYPMTVIGVLPTSAQLPDRTIDMWLPAFVDSRMPAMNNHTWKAIGRLRAGHTAAEAQRELAPLTARLPELFPQAENENFVRTTGFYTQVRPLRDVVVGDQMIRALWILFGSVMLVLVIAAANLSNLFLVRIDARRREMAVRAALGADRMHLAIQLFSESLVIALLAGVLAVTFATVGLRLLLVVAPSELPRLSEVHLGVSGVAFALTGALLTAFALGLLPLAGPATLDIGLLREGGRGLTSSKRRQLVRAALVVSQVALSLVLLTASGLMVRSFMNLRAVKPGFDPRGVVTMNISLPQGDYGKSSERTSFVFQQIAERIQQVPGVIVAGYSEKIPLASGYLCTGVAIEGNEDSRARGDCPPTSMVSPGYFEAMGIKVEGEALTWQNMNAKSGDMVISRAFADHIWPNESAMHKGIKYNDYKPPFYRVSGIAADVLAEGSDKPPVTVVYFPMLPIDGAPLYGPVTSTNLVVRTRSSDPIALTPGISKIVSEIEPRAAISNAQSMESLVSKSMAKRSFTMMLLSIAAAMALFLSVVGLYGVISYVVGQRRSEIAIRMALGAPAAAVGRMIVGQSVRLALVGVVIGIVASLASLRVLQSLLFGVSPTDPLLMAGASLLLVVVAAAAGYGPAYRAAHVDPADVLRTA